MKRVFTKQEAMELGEQIGIDFGKIDLEQFRLGLSIELEHGNEYAETNVTNDDLSLTGRIAWAHLKELPNYYTLLTEMERRAEQ